jgi:thioredoxin 1
MAGPLETSREEEKRLMANPRIREFDDATFDAEVLAASRPVLVEIGATWCGPCKALAPILGKIAEERAGQLTVGLVDIDESPAVAARFGIRGVPTLLVFAGGREVARQVGVTSHARLRQILDDATGTPRTEVGDA